MQYFMDEAEIIFKESQQKSSDALQIHNLEVPS